MGWTSVLIDCHRVEPGDEAFETHPTSDQTLVVMTRGEQHFDVLKGGSWRGTTYRAGTVGLTPPGDTVRLRRRVHGNPRAFEKANLYVPPQFLQEAAEQLGRAGQSCRAHAMRHAVLDDLLIAQTVFALLRAMSTGASDLYAQSAMHWLAVHLLSVIGLAGDPRNDGRCPGLLSDRRLGRVVDYMKAHFADDLTLERLAAEAGISKFHFTRLFRESTGLTPHAFLVRLRMDAGRHLLRTSDLGVKQVAARCGFSRVAHFGAAFAKHTGLSPTAFRNRPHG